MNVRYAVVLVKIIVKRKIGNLWCRGRLGFDSLKLAFTFYYRIMLGAGWVLFSVVTTVVINNEK